MVFVTPVELIILFIMLIRGGVNTKFAVFIRSRLILGFELVFLKRFRVVLGSVCGDRR